MATLTIAAVSPKKTGTTNDRQWTLYEVRAKNGKPFTTFDAEWARHIGETVETDVDGRGRLGVFPKPAPAVQKTHVSPTPAAPDRFVILDQKLDRILKELAALRAHFR